MSSTFKDVQVSPNMKFTVPENFELIKKLGSGAYGTVASFCQQDTGKKVAVKKIPDAFQDLIDGKRNVREVKILKSLRHENIVSILDMFQPATRDFDDIYVVLDLMDSDLSKIFRSTQLLTEDHHQFFLYQILLAVHYIHSAGVVHRDLKPANVLVNTNCDVKICDFGLARVIEEHERHIQEVNLDAAVTEEAQLTDYVCTRWWRAPEVVLLAGQYFKSVDMWSVGCILGEALGRKVLFQGKDHLDQLKKIVQVIGTPSDADLDFLQPRCPGRTFISKLPAASKQPWSSKFPDISQQAAEALDAMICFHPGRRATAKEALALPYFSELYQQDDLKPAECQVDLRFDSCQLTKRSLQNLIFVECHEFHPEQSFEAHAVVLQPEEPADDGTTRIHCRSLGGDLLMTTVANQNENLIALRAAIARKLDEPAELIRLVAEDSRVLSVEECVMSVATTVLAD